jgi:hypothetical protein
MNLPIKEDSRKAHEMNLDITGERHWIMRVTDSYQSPDDIADAAIAVLIFVGWLVVVVLAIGGWL